MAPPAQRGIKTHLIMVFVQFNVLSIIIANTNTAMSNIDRVTATAPSGDTENPL
jgi:hypothetical protein